MWGMLSKKKKNATINWRHPKKTLNPRSKLHVYVTNFKIVENYQFWKFSLFKLYECSSPWWYILQIPFHLKFLQWKQQPFVVRCQRLYHRSRNLHKIWHWRKHFKYDTNICSEKFLAGTMSALQSCNVVSLNVHVLCKCSGEAKFYRIYTFGHIFFENNAVPWKENPKYLWCNKYWHCGNHRTKMCPCAFSDLHHD